jgi:hypothetical protein
MTSLDYFTRRADELERVAAMWEGSALSAAEYAAWLEAGHTTPNGRPGAAVARREADTLAKVADGARRDADYARQIATSVQMHPSQPREHPVPCKGLAHPLADRPDTWNVNGLCDPCSEDQLEQRLLDLEARDRALDLADAMGGA